jgi:hypothetical protein
MITLGTPSLPATRIPQFQPNAPVARADVADSSLATLSAATSTISPVSPATFGSQEGEVFLHVTQAPATLNTPELTYGLQDLMHMKLGMMQVWEQPSDNALGQLMGRNATATTAPDRLAGLGTALLEQIGSKTSSYRQSVVNVIAPDSAQKIQAKATNSLAGFQSAPSARVELTVQTQSGASVRLVIVDQGEGGVIGTGISVELVVDGKLSEAESSALKSLASGFEKAIQGLAGDATQIDLEGLSQFDSHVISKLTLQANIYGRDALGIRYEKLAASFTADANTREIQLKRPDGEVKMKTDLRQPVLWGSSEQKAYAVEQYLQHMDQAAQRGHASTDLVGMFKSTFKAMNTSYGSQEANPKASAATAIGPVNLAEEVTAWSDEDKSLLTGLADFDATLTATPRASNPHKPMEKDRFQYSVNQSTVISGSSKSNRAITQAQSAQLNAAYHQSLLSSKPPLLDDKTESQNYTYHQIEDSSSTQMHFGYERDVLVAATLTQSFSQSQRVQKYEHAKLIEDRVIAPGVQQRQTDLLPLLKQLKDQQAAHRITHEEKQDLLRSWNAMVFQGF